MTRTITAGTPADAATALSDAQLDRVSGGNLDDKANAIGLAYNMPAAVALDLVSGFQRGITKRVAAKIAELWNRP